MFNVTPVFYANYNATEKVVINQGGTASSKTYSIMQLLYLRAIEKKRVITVTGESIPNLKKGAYRDAQSIYDSTEGLKAYIKAWNQTERVINFHNGSIIEFTTNETEQSAKAGKRHILFATEANGLNWLIFWQQAIRTTEQIFIDYNPSAKFWAHENLIGTNEDSNDLSATVKLIISDHRHNTFLSESQHRAIENIKDKDLWSVYARGKTGNLIGLIFPNWRRIEPGQFPDDDFIVGIDFGYTNDPTAIVKVAWGGENIYVQELAYAPGIPAKEIVQILKANGVKERETRIYCEHDPDMISQLTQLRMLSIPARKGQGSINAGIMKLKEYHVYYTNDSGNLDNELSRYMWAMDKNTGKPTNTPAPGFDHLIDATRYAVYSHFYRMK